MEQTTAPPAGTSTESRMDRPAVPLPEDEPTITIPRAAELLGISRSSAYQAAACGELPVIRFGRRELVPTASFRRLIGLDP